MLLHLYAKELLNDLFADIRNLHLPLVLSKLHCIIINIGYNIGNKPISYMYK